VRRSWYVVALVLLLAGLYGLNSVSPITQAPDAVALEMRFPGTTAAQGTVVVQQAGEHAIWASGGPERDANRCRITAPSGPAVPVTAAPARVVWEIASEDDAVYTWIAGFSAARPGTYGIQCSPDPEAPGAAYHVTKRPAIGPAVARGAAGGVAVLAAAALALTIFLRRRRRAAAAAAASTGSVGRP
jgi:hypothetical protein